MAESHFKILITLGCLLAGLPAFGQSEEDDLLARPWHETRSAHFVLYSCAPTAEVAKVANRFEQFRDAYGELAGTAAVVSPPIVVMVFPDVRSMWRFGFLYQGKPSTNYGAFFHHDPRVNVSFIVLALSRNERKWREKVFHEYTHWLLRANGTIWPVWLTEGMADIYATLEASGHEVVIGKPQSSHLRILNEEPLLPLSKLFRVEPDSPEYNEREHQGILYAQSWLLAHYLMLGDNPAHTARFPTLTKLLRQGQSPETAFVNTFQTSLPEMEAQLQRYLKTGKFQTATRRVQTDLSATHQVTTRGLSPAEARFRLGDQLLRVNRLDDAETYFRQARQLAPRGYLYHEGLGLVYARRTNSAAAVRYLADAIQLGSANYLVHFTHARERYRIAAETGTKEEWVTFRPIDKPLAAEIRSGYLKSITLMRTFAPAHFWLGFLEMLQGENLPGAEGYIRKAIELEPENPNYILTLADLQVRRNNLSGARQTLEPLLRPNVEPDLRARAEEILQNITR